MRGPKVMVFQVGGASVYREEMKIHDLSQWQRVVCLNTKLNLSCVSL